MLVWARYLKAPIWAFALAVGMLLPVAAQDMPDLTRLPVLSAPGSMAGAALPDQAAWLSVGQPGVYHLQLDGPGGLALSHYDTPDGRSDGSDGVRQLQSDGTFQRPGVLADLLLLPGNAYLVQIVADQPRGLVLALDQPIDPASALTGDAIPGHDDSQPVMLTPGQDLLLAPTDLRHMTITPAAPLAIMALSPPGAHVVIGTGGRDIGPGGLYPLAAGQALNFDLTGDTDATGNPLPLLIRAAAPPGPAQTEGEPGPTDLGSLPGAGQRITGTLLAASDHDDFTFALPADQVIDLGIALSGPAKAHLALQRQDKSSWTNVLEGDLTDGRFDRLGLSLIAGDYRITVSGETSAPRPYTVTLTPAPVAVSGEPDDTPDTARLLTPGQALRGELAEDNPGFVRFAVANARHLWEIRAVQGVRNLSLTGPDELNFGDWSAGDGEALALRLALPPGPFVLGLRGDGPYALRLADLGPLPDGAEAEPNGSETTAQPILPGQTLSGDFQSEGDRDLYQIDLPVPTPLTLHLTPPDDGAAAVTLSPPDAPSASVDFGPDTGALDYTALFPAGLTLLDLHARDQGISGRYTVQLTRAAAAEPFEPSGSAALPGDGRISGTLGGLDQIDHIFVPLPAGSGVAAFQCTGAIDHWSLWTFGQEDQLLRGDGDSPVTLAYDPTMGGGLDWRVEGGAVAGPYACRMAFAPKGDLTAGTDPATLPPGHSVAGHFTDDSPEQNLSLDLPQAAMAALTCTLPQESVRAEDYRLDRVLGQMPLSDGSHILAGDAAPWALRLVPDPDKPLPQDWTCGLYADTALQTAEQVGPAAAFTGRVTPDAPPFDAAAALATLSGGRPDWLAPVQVRQDLDVDLSLTGLDQPFRAYARLGQGGDVVVSVANHGPARDLDLTLNLLSDGWRISPGTAHLTLAAGATGQVTAHLDLPPMQSPLLLPALQIVAKAGDQTRAMVQDIPLTAEADERAPALFWTAPPALLGGLDPMRYQMGGRLIALDDTATDEGEQADWAPLHDDDAPASGIHNRLRARRATFKLAETAPIAGAFVYLRTTDPRSDWPDKLALELSADGTSWAKAADLTLTASDKPQVFALPTPITAGFARITRSGCRADPSCDGVVLADVGLIARPDWRPAQPQDIADPALGGHVVAGLELGGTALGERAFGGTWNDDLLTENSAASLLGASDTRGDRAVAIIAFNRNRAARITGIDWQALQGDADKPAVPAAVEVSLGGPAGPWVPMGDLPPPDGDAATSHLQFSEPVWARAVRLTFPRAADEQRRLPDRIRIWEDPKAPSILGFWEDDRPEAGFEATGGVSAMPIPPPLGGADQAGAAALPLDQPIASSVQLERNADWWRLDAPPGPASRLTLRFDGAAQPEFAVHVLDSDGHEATPKRSMTPEGDLLVQVTLKPGPHWVQVVEPPRSVAILWDTSGSVEEYLPAILNAVPAWALSLKPGRDRLQLLPFGATQMLLDDFAETPDAVAPALTKIGPEESSDAETALGIASDVLTGLDGSRGIVIVTDAETSQSDHVWVPMLAAHPRIVALSIDSSDPAGVRIMRDWAAIDRGLFFRVDGHSGMGDAMDMAAALFRAPKGYRMTASLSPLPAEDQVARLTLQAAPGQDAAKPSGAIEVILDASGSMLQRLPDGTRKIAAAHDALVQLVQHDLPPGAPFAFRVFGLAPSSCDSRLDLPLGPLDPDAAAKSIAAVPAVNRAKTAIADSLAAAAGDLTDVQGPRVVVLLTDGEETCGGDVAGQIAALKDQGLDLRLTIVGFAVDDAAVADTFAGWAATSGGQYLPAGDGAGLAKAMAEATEVRFAATRLAEDGSVMGDPLTLALDQTVTLPPGRWQIAPLQTAAGAPVVVDIDPGSDLSLAYDPASGLSSQFQTKD